eukprot:74520_1
MSHEHDFKWLSEPPACDYWQPCPIFYHSKAANKPYLIFTPDSNDSKNCIVYDCHDDEYLDLTYYPDEFVLLASTHALDTETEHLYIFGGEHSLFGILNVISGDWIYSSTENNALQRFDYAQSYFIKNNLKKEIHLFGSTSLFRSKHESSHLVYSIDDNNECNKSNRIFQTMKKYQLSTYNSSDGLPLHMETQSQILIAADSPDKLYSFDLYAQYPNKKIIIPDTDWYSKDCRKFLIVFNDILCVFDATNGNGKRRNVCYKLWFKCLGNKSHTWKCTNVVLRRWEYSIVVHEYDDYIHFINTDRSDLFHVKIPIHKLLPEVLVMDKYNMLVCGFIAKMQKKLNLPLYDYQHMCQIVLSYFPLLLK